MAKKPPKITTITKKSDIGPGRSMPTSEVKITKPMPMELSVIDPIFKRKRVSRRGLAAYAERCAAAYAPIAIPQAFECVLRAVVGGDQDAAFRLLETFGLGRVKAGIIINNIQANQNVGNLSPAGFDSTVREFQERTRSGKPSVLDVQAEP